VRDAPGLQGSDAAERPKGARWAHAEGVCAARPPAGITGITDGYPNANGHIQFERANLAEVLGQHGWNTYHVGNWHLRTR
jgi:hypothetical protein